MFRRSTAIILASLPIASTAGAAVVTLSAPAGLANGTKFRFLIVTSATTTAASTNIGDYDSFVNTDAGGATYNGSVVTWKALGSTATVDARDHVGGYGSSVAVYRVNGSKLADDMTTGTNGLWSGTILTAPAMTISSTVVLGAAWTGTQANGTKSSDVLGAANVTRGLITQSGGFWLNQAVYANSNSMRVYGVSEELTYGVIPAPGVVAFLGIAGLATRRRRR